MATWSDLTAELETWRQLGQVPTLWWRDDDAATASAPLKRLLNLADDAGVPIALAVIAADADSSLVDCLSTRPDVQVLCHGWRHQNHAPPDAKKTEFAAQRPVFEMLGDIALAWQRLRPMFAERALPVLVPPWNRIAPQLVAQLHYGGIAGLSRFGPRQGPLDAAHLTEANCHVDLIAWRGDRGFVGADAALDGIVGHLAARRAGIVDPGEPTGLLTHHLNHDQATWDFIEALFRHTGANGGRYWLSAREIFNLPR